MANRHLLIVEGSHDAAFFGRLLTKRGFREARTFPEVPDFWKPTIPRQFPVRRDGRLERIMPFPEIYAHAKRGDTVAIEVAAGDAAVLNALRSALDVYQVADFTSLSLVLDTDWDLTEAQRFAAFRRKIDQWNATGLEDERPGFPVMFPDAPNTVAPGPPRVGIYLLPGGGEQGTLETILLACAQANHPFLHQHALNLIKAIEDLYPVEVTPDPLRDLRRDSGRSKAQCGIIGNVFKPGASLSVSLRQTIWLPEAEDAIPALQAAANFLDALLGSTP